MEVLVDLEEEMVEVKMVAEEEQVDILELVDTVVKTPTTPLTFLEFFQKRGKVVQVVVDFLVVVVVETPVVEVVV